MPTWPGVSCPPLEHIILAGNALTSPDWAVVELLSQANLKGKGQQRMLIGAMYQGAMAHTRYQAGGNEKCQVQVSKVGIVTTSEKYTIAHSNHVGVHFAAFRWHHHSPVEYEESSDEHGDYYRRSEYYRRHQDREPDASEPDWSANNQ